MKLIIPKDIPSDFIGNGCGSEGWLGKLVPEDLAGINISESCKYHDWLYSKGGCEEDKLFADITFLHNMIATIKRDDTIWTNEDKAIRMAIVYYEAVVLYGNKYFNWRA